MEFNKIAGAILMAFLIIVGINSLADTFYHVDKPAEDAFPVLVADAGGHG